ncbi:hypothetical protein [Mycobacterium sp. shizuoka-1]|uniref:hypothetical protein n=1 Tax=Mycobacterium sp. shizuoka-1 TaxID=2039281 RepID=UPI000C066DA3|nr:hypothetical protein [Mycobacterium sp. shizuoka-1]GAY14797.1 hypothetical protein MSZK_15230 [Mycobacterium sp. shizuoka-1]
MAEPTTVPLPVATAPAGPRRRRAVLSYVATRRELWARIVLVLALAAIAYVVPAVNGFSEAAAGSLSGYTLMLPLLAALVVAGYTRPPQGVSDAETDWIVAILVCGGGFLAVTLFSQRLPTLAALWRVDNLRPALWAAGAAMVVFSVRHVLRMWTVWAYVVLTAPVMTYLLLTAELGGSDEDAAFVAAVFGTVAVYFSARVVNWRWRLLATGLNFGIAAALIPLTGYLTDSLLPRMMIVAGALPLLTIFVVHHGAHVTGTQRFPHLRTQFPHRGGWSYPALIVISLALLFTSLHAPKEPDAPMAHGNWATQLGLRPVAQFDFISRFVGPGATLTRYQLPAGREVSGLAIDVISAPSLARLRDYSSAIWYPSPAPTNYQPISLPAPVSAVSLQSGGASVSRPGQSSDWYLLTWIWEVPTGYQRVTIIMDQGVRPSQPPAPRPLTLRNSLIEPLAWLAREQPDPANSTPAPVLAATNAVAREILSAGAPA